MEGSNVIYIPHRVTNEIPIAALLKDVIAAEFYQSPALFEDDLKGLNSLRNKMINSIESNSTDITTGLPILKEYYCQLCYIERKFPKDCISFTWFSNNLTYQPNNKITLKSFQFEKLNILYNLASFYSKFAFKQDRSDLEGLKIASLNFQNAAGIFQMIIDFIPQIKDFQVPLEYSIEAITGLQYLMLAQAQEAYWQRAISSSGDKVVAILSQQVGEFYRSSYESFNKSQFILRSEFLNHINCKSYHFLAATHYRMAQHEYTLSNYGEQVAHLKELYSLCSKGTKSLKGVSDVVVNDLKGLEDAIKSMLKNAEKENDLIYHKDIPKMATPVKGRPMVKSMTFDDLSNPVSTVKQIYKSKLFFENLLPYIVIQSSQAFKERQEEFVMNNLINPVNTLTKILKNFISERSLPLSLDSITKPQRLPDNLIQHCLDLLSNDALSKLRISLKDLSKLSVESRHLIDGCKERIDIEAQENEFMRERQGTKRWNRLSSEEASKDLVEKIHHYEQYLIQASSGDDTIRHNVKEIKPYLEMMANLAVPGINGRDKLMKFIPTSDLVKLSPELHQVIKLLKDVLSESANEINKRQQFIEAVEMKSRDSAILPKIISEYRIMQSNDNVVITEETFEPLFSKHLKNFDIDLNNLYKTRDQQTKLEQQIDSLNKKFILASSNTEKMTTARKEALQTLDDAFNGYKENMENITEGLKFYRDFIENVSNLLNQCDDFVYQRRLEGRELEQKLNKSEELNLSSTPRKIRIPQPQTPSRATVAAVKPPTSISQKNYKTLLSDDETNSEGDSFHTDGDTDDSFERNALFVTSDGSKSPLKLKRRNNGEKFVTKVELQSPISRKSRKEKENTGGFWDPKLGIKFD